MSLPPCQRLEPACLYCEEPVYAVEPHKIVHAVLLENGKPTGRRRAAHRECVLREVVGSVGCQRGECPNCGDPPGMSRREAARAAVAFWEAAGGPRRGKPGPRS